MDWGLFTRLCREMKEYGVEEIGLFYISEPFFQAERLIESVKYCKELGFSYIFLTTNGSLAKPELVKRAMEAGLNSLKFSINFSDYEQFTRIAQRPWVNYERALQNLKEARRVRDEGNYNCGIYASSIQFDGRQAEKMEKLLAERVRPYVDECYMLPLYSFGGAKIDEVGKPIAGNQGRIGALREGIPCWALWEGHIRASPDGTRAYLSACCFGSDDKFDVADLTDTSFQWAWNNKEFIELREAHLRKEIAGTACESCLAYA
jgi:MoaA/NifB/PqqE/SkfB family radical SAM enzyme